MEDNTIVQIWSEKTQLEKGDNLMEGYTSELWDFTRTSVTRNNLQELKEIWVQWDDEVDLVPTVEEHTALLRCLRIQTDKAYFRAVNVLIIFRDLILAHPDTKKKVDVFALSIYGLIIFPKALGHIEEAVSDSFDILDRRVTPVPVILAETFRSLNACQRTDEDVEWRAPWMVPDEILYRCGNLDWVPLLGIWGAVGYAPLLVLRQYKSR
ncbi:hypothetical protein Gohar_027051 [Gossypium harknessii]|uniref:DUF7745 domain-containing protein n=1 Tax=Gossypium harknessii TaxID=34285 RepID=A0A7J9HTI9_9ROSI|nr:hypothetical protein [Gossypium harknessii]